MTLRQRLKYLLFRFRARKITAAICQDILQVTAHDIHFRKTGSGIRIFRNYSIDGFDVYDGDLLKDLLLFSIRTSDVRKHLIDAKTFYDFVWDKFSKDAKNESQSR